MVFINTESINLLILIIFGLVYLGLIFVASLHRSFPRPKDIFFLERSKRRIPFFDVLKGVAILAVIIIHASLFLGTFTEQFSLSFLEGNEHIARLFRFAIPFFLISSGALLTLANLKRDTLRKFYLNRFLKILVPYAIFSSLATALYSTGLQDLFQFLVAASKDILTGQALVPFWFIPLLIQFYLLFPFLWYLFIVKKMRPSLILLVSFLLSFGFYLLRLDWTGWTMIFGSFPFLGPYLFFFVLGIVLKPLVLSGNREWLGKIHIGFWTLLIIILYLSLSMLNPLERYYNVRLIFGPTIFLALYYFYPWFSHSRLNHFFQKAGENSLYLYLIHFFVLSFLTKLIIFSKLLSLNPFLLFTGLTLFGFLITYFLSFAARRFYDSCWRRLAL